MKRVASIQDISCLGRCSLTVALPVISAMEVECAILPTAVLSAHTMFPDILCRDLTADILPIARYWQSQQVRLDAVYTGYLASPRQVEDVCQALEVLAGPDTLRFVDPAMADGGALYTGFDEDFPRHMARLAAQADVVTPNLTEACLLTGTPYREDYDLPQLRDILRKLAELGPRHVVLTGVPYGPDKLGVLAYTPAEERFFEYGSRRIDAHFPGTGGLFSSSWRASPRPSRNDGGLRRWKHWASRWRRPCVWRWISRCCASKSPAGMKTPHGTGWSLKKH